MGYLLFDKDRDGFDDGEGNNVSLGEHLDYVNSGGTPDCWMTVDGSRNEAIKEAQNSGMSMYVVCEDMLRVVAEVKSPAEMELEL